MSYRLSFGSDSATLAAPMLLDFVITPVSVSKPWLCTSWIVRLLIWYAPGFVSTFEAGFHLPLSSAVGIVHPLIGEPGPTTSVSARLRRKCGSDFSFAFGLNDGLLTSASTSPLRTSRITI